MLRFSLYRRFLRARGYRTFNYAGVHLAIKATASGDVDVGLDAQSMGLDDWTEKTS